MSLKRFQARSHKDAMRQVREALGADAIIVMSRTNDEGNEIFAVREEELDSLAAAPVVTSQPNDLTRQLLHDVQEMRLLLQQQVATSEPLDQRKWCYLKLRSAGYSDTLARELVALLPAHLNAAQATQEDLQAWLTEQLQMRLKGAQRDWELLHHEGVVALVGPTGVGKTTTTAKLAAHYVMQMGGDSLLLVTTDSFRIGAQQQLATYAELLNVDIFALHDDADLAELQAKMQNKRLVLVDTVGMSQRDHRLTQRVAALATPELGAKPRLALLLNTAAQQATLNEVASIYHDIAKQLNMPLNDCILTKVDEASCVGGALDTAIRHRLSVQAVSSGQQVPEDILAPDFQALVSSSMAVRNAAKDAYEDTDIELPESLSTRSQTAIQHAHMLRDCVEGLAAALPDFAAVQGQLLNPSRVDTAAENLPSATTIGRWATAKRATNFHQSIPHFGFNERGQLALTPLLQSHAAPWNAQAHLRGHLFDFLPTDAELGELNEQSLAWLARVNRQHRFYHQGKKASAADILRRHGIKLDSYSRTYRAEVHRLSISLAAVARAEGSEEYLQLACVKLQPSSSKKRAVERYFLVYPSCTAEQLYDFIGMMLSTDELDRLTRKAWPLVEQHVDSVDASTLLYLSALLASSAASLAHSQAPTAATLRAQLMALTQRTGKADAHKLLPAIWQCVLAYDAFQLGAPAHEASA